MARIRRILARVLRVCVYSASNALPCPDVGRTDACSLNTTRVLNVHILRVRNEYLTFRSIREYLHVRLRTYTSGFYVTAASETRRRQRVRPVGPTVFGFSVGLRGSDHG